MKYRGIEYAVRARPGLDEWTWTIYPDGAEPRQGQISGVRSIAVTAAMRAIDAWVQKSRQPQKT